MNARKTILAAALALLATPVVAAARPDPTYVYAPRASLWEMGMGGRAQPDAADAGMITSYPLTSYASRDAGREARPDARPEAPPAADAEGSGSPGVEAARATRYALSSSALPSDRG